MGPKYLLYFSLIGNITYDESEFNTIKKIIKNLILNRYYNLDVVIQFNEEIMNYNIIKKELTNNIMLIMGQIDDNLVDDLIYEITCILGIDKVERRRSTNDFNSTGYSDMQLNKMYNDYLVEASKLQIDFKANYSEKLKDFASNFNYYNLSYIDPSDYLSFCHLFLENRKKIESFLMLQEFNVLEALFANFPFFIKYLQSLDFSSIVKYYSKETINILRNIRNYVSQSEDYNDDIKELFVYKLLLTEHFHSSHFFFDPEEGFDKIKNQIIKMIEQREEEVINNLSDKVKLFKDNYRLISIADPMRKTFQEYNKIAKVINKHFDKLQTFLKSFRAINNTFVKFNSKMKYPERIKATLDLFKKSGIVQDYQEKYGLYSINLATTEHIPFLQGRWFEYYTATLCKEILENLKSQGYEVNYEVYQNVIYEINGVRRELDVIVYVNGVVFYIENKIESKNAFRSDLEKYRFNMKNMNLKHCYLVYLEGENRKSDVVKFYSLQSFKNKFKKEALKILEAERQEKKAKELAKEKEKRNHELALKIITKERTSLYLRHRIDYEAEEKKIRRAIERYDSELLKITLPNKNKFFDETLQQIKDAGNKELLDKFIKFKDQYETDYFNKIAYKKYDTIFFKRIAKELQNIDENNILVSGCEKLFCLAGDIQSFLNIGTKNVERKLLILCGYGLYLDKYLEIIKLLLESKYLLAQDRSCYLLVYYINNIHNIRDSIIINDFMEIIFKYYLLVDYLFTNRIVNFANNILALRKEREFISVLIYSFMKKHLNNFPLYGLILQKPETFFYRMATNDVVYMSNLKELEIGKQLLFFRPRKIAYYEDQYSQISKFIIDNYQNLKESLKLMVGCDERLTFILPHNPLTNNFLSILKESLIISEYKEIKSLKKNVGIFNKFESLNWIKNKAYLGNYLNNRYQSNSLYTNVLIKADNNEYRILFIKETRNKAFIALSMEIEGEEQFAIEYIEKNHFYEVLNALRPCDFHYRVENMIEFCDRKLLQKTQQKQIST